MFVITRVFWCQIKWPFGQRFIFILKSLITSLSTLFTNRLAWWGKNNVHENEEILLFDFYFSAADGNVYQISWTNNLAFLILAIWSRSLQISLGHCWFVQLKYFREGSESHYRVQIIFRKYDSSLCSGCSQQPQHAGRSHTSTVVCIGSYSIIFNGPCILIVIASKTHYLFFLITTHC